VTKHAAQQRHTHERPRRERHGTPFKRFTSRARMSVREANAAADELGHTYVGTEHLLLGILAVPQSVGAKALAALGLEREHVISALEEGGGGGDRRRRRLPFTPLAKQTLELGLGEALRLGHSYVGTEHIALGLLRVNDGLAAKVMKERGIEANALLGEIDRILAA
jgi:ATP-dependent Clp protease ATP-binding subunit ClpC